MLSLDQCFDDITNLAQEGELIDGADNMVAQLNSQCSVISALKRSFGEFLNRTNYLQSYVQGKQQDLQSMKEALSYTEKEL